jgi:hypothetical protein
MRKKRGKKRARGQKPGDRNQPYLLVVVNQFYRWKGKAIKNKAAILSLNL